MVVRHDETGSRVHHDARAEGALHALLGHAAARLAEEAAHELVHAGAAPVLLDACAVDVDHGGRDALHDRREGKLHLRAALGRGAMLGECGLG